MDNQSCSGCAYIDTPSSKEPCKSCFEDGNTHPNYKQINDPTNPDHYKSETSLECIEAMEIIFGKVPVLDFCLCNAWKYIWRWKNKNGLVDLNKAKWYLDRAATYIDQYDACMAAVVWSRQYNGMVRYLKENGVDIDSTIELVDIASKDGI